MIKTTTNQTETNNADEKDEYEKEKDEEKVEIFDSLQRQATLAECVTTTATTAATATTSPTTGEISVTEPVLSTATKLKTIAESNENINSTSSSQSSTSYTNLNTPTTPLESQSDVVAAVAAPSDVSIALSHTQEADDYNNAAVTNASNDDTTTADSLSTVTTSAAEAQSQQQSQQQLLISKDSIDLVAADTNNDSCATDQQTADHIDAIEVLKSTSTSSTTTSTASPSSPGDSSDCKDGFYDNQDVSKVVLRKTSATLIVSREVGDEQDAISNTSTELIRPSSTTSYLENTNVERSLEKTKSGSRLSERAKKKSWYNVLYPNYKSRSQDFKKLFKEVPNDERLIVDYSCALQRDILVQGRLYVSQNYLCFYANIFGWETYLTIKWKDVTSITKEKTALVIPNAILICTAIEKHFFATFTSRDKSFLMLFRVWQNTLMNKPMPAQEVWRFVHNCYGDELGLTTDDEDYIDPTSILSLETLDSDLDFVSAFEEAQSEYSTASVLNPSISKDVGGDDNNKNNKKLRNSGSSSGGGTNVTKSKTRSYFFSSKKSSFNSSANTTASASGSDNNSNAKRNNRNKMNANAKELTLISVKPDEIVRSSSAGTVAALNGSGSGSANVLSTAPIKEVKIVSYDGKRKVTKNSRQRDESLSKNSEALPTDMSDSSDSDENQIPFVATAECNSTHEGRQLVHTILPINIDTLFNLLFSKSKFLVDFHTQRKSLDTHFGEWATNEENQRTRIVNLTVQLTASVGPKTSKVTENQVMRECSKTGELYSIDVTSTNAGIPYADSFSVLLHYCLVRTVDDHTMLSVHAQIKYTKSVWNVVKGFIEKNTWAGLEDFYGALLHALQSETCVPPAKGKGRRPRRGNAMTARPLEALDVPCATQMHTEQIAQKGGHMHATHSLLPSVAIGVLRKAPAIPTQNKFKWVSLFVIVLLLFLILLNVILLHKLWQLEARIEVDRESRTRIPNLAALKQLPNTDQEWIELLREQEILHETELKKWHFVLQTAVELLKKTEKTLAELMFR